MLDFIKNQMSLGVSREAITKMLIGQGWTVSDVEEAYRGLQQMPEVAKQVVAPPVQPVSRPVEMTSTLPSTPFSTPGNISMTPKPVQMSQPIQPIQPIRSAQPTYPSQPIQPIQQTQPSRQNQPFTSQVSPVASTLNKLDSGKIDLPTTKVYNAPLVVTKASTKVLEVILIILIFVCVIIAGMYTYNTL